MRTMSAVHRGFAFDPGDWSVGLHAGWDHVDCPEDGQVDEALLTVVRVDSMTVRSWYLLTCTDCAQQAIVTDTDYSPDEGFVDDPVPSYYYVDDGTPCLMFVRNASIDTGYSCALRRGRWVSRRLRRD